MPAQLRALPAALLATAFLLPTPGTDACNPSSASCPPRYQATLHADDEQANRGLLIRRLRERASRPGHDDITFRPGSNRARIEVFLREQDETHVRSRIAGLLNPATLQLQVVHPDSITLAPLVKTGEKQIPGYDLMELTNGGGNSAPVVRSTLSRHFVIPRARKPRALAIALSAPLPAKVALESIQALSTP